MFPANAMQVPVYIAEITPKDLRGGFAAVNQVQRTIQEAGF